MKFIHMKNQKKSFTTENYKMKVVLLGAPNAGKGTYASRLKKTYKIPHISTGDLLRNAVKEGSELGLQAKEAMDKGELVSDELVINLLKERLAKDDAKNGIFLDGFPRTIKQAEMLDKLIGINAVLKFDVSDEVAIKRSTSRIICKGCNAIFNTIRLPPKQEGICDHCKGELYQRDDDTEETMIERLKTYYEKVNPIIQFYESKGILHSVNSDIDINNPNCTAIEDAQNILNKLIDTVEEFNKDLKE